MRILVISDLHLCDSRNAGTTDEFRLEQLGKFIRESRIDAVLNLGDTVSRDPLRYDRFPTLESGFEFYLNWRKQFNIPFVETAIHRELKLFHSLFGYEPDSFHNLFDDGAIIAMLPRGSEVNTFTPLQLEFLRNSLKKCSGKTVVIGTHSPFTGSCSRVGKPGTFVDVPPEVKEELCNFPGRIIWCGGHFHWENEPPAVTGSLTALYASRFRIISRDDTSYTSTIDTATGKITVDFHNF